MRVVSCVALIGAATAKPIELEIIDNETADISTDTKTEMPEVPKPVQRKPIMPTLPPNYKPMFSDDPEFRSFAVKNQFPPVVEERQMMAQFNHRSQKFPKTNPFMERVQEEPKQLTCMECSGNSYEECYMNGRERTCPQQETSCFLEVRYRGETVVSVQSGCMQEIACINNMKQNFYDFNEYGQGGVNMLDQGRHDCKIFGGNPFSNSVCRNCCFTDNCTDGWQPTSFEDWNIADRKEVKNQMQLFDQFVYAPNHWDNLKQQRQHHQHRGSIQYVNSVADLNRPPTMADLNRNKPKINRAPPVVATKSPRDHVASFRAKQLAAQRKRQLEQQQRQRIQSFRQPTVVKPTQKPTTKAPATRRQWQRKTPKVTTTKRVTTTTTTTAKPTTTTPEVNDADFMALIAMLESSEKAETKIPDPVEKKSTKSKLSKKKTQKPPKPVQLKSAVKVVKTTSATTTTTEKVTTTAATTVKPTAKKPVRKGPWSHLPPWKQRQLQAARQKAIAQAKAKKAAALAKQKQQAQPQMMKFSSSVEAPGITLNENVFNVQSTLNDEEFGKLIASMDAKDNDLDAIVKVIEAETEAVEEIAAEEIAVIASEESDH